VSQPAFVVSETTAYYRENNYNNKKSNDESPESCWFSSQTFLCDFHL